MAEHLVRIGLVGMGRHGMRYASHLLAGDVPRARLVAVTRRDRDLGTEWADLRGLAFHDEVEALVADPGVDMVVAAAPPAVHPVVVKLAARYRKPILVEKPLAPSGAAAREALDAARTAGITAMVAQTMRFSTVVRELKQRAPQCGPLHLVAIDNRFEPADRPWFNEPDHGGMVINTGAHGIDLLRFLTGAEIVEVHALGNRIATPDVDDVFAAVLRLEPGRILATLDNTWATGGRTGRVELTGRDGQLVADHVHNLLAEVHGRKMTPVPCPPPVPTVREVLRSFIACLLDGAPVPVTLEDGLAAVVGAELIANELR
jgi:predicted dehydrogenase